MAATSVLYITQQRKAKESHDKCQVEIFKRELLVANGICTENYVHYSKINPWIQGNYIYAQTNSEKIPCDVIYLLSIPELCWLKTTYFLNLYLQNRKGFSTQFASLPHITTFPRFHILECINQWENKQLFRIFIFENGSCHVCRIIYTHNYFTRPQYLICFICFYCHYIYLHLYKRTKKKKSMTHQCTKNINCSFTCI